MRCRPKTLLAVVGAWLVIGSCAFDASIPNAKLACGSTADCPTGYSCQMLAGSNPSVSVCCKGGDCGAAMKDDGGSESDAEAGANIPGMTDGPGRQDSPLERLVVDAPERDAKVLDGSVRFDSVSPEPDAPMADPCREKACS